MYPIIHLLLNAYVLILILRAVLSFLPMASQRRLPWPAVKFIYDVTEPALQPIRRLLAPYQRNSPLDFSMLVLVLVLQLLDVVAYRVLG